MSSVATEVVRLAGERGISLATAESLTGGLVAAALTDVPGASTVVRGGIVAYASDVKVSLLGVPEDLVATSGVVSAECARAMAIGVRGVLAATWGVATTGVAGPGSQEGKPVGTVYVAVAGPDDVDVEELALAGSRDDIRSATVEATLQLILRVLRREEPAVR
ncbi:competence damage-inducible protein A [Nocardioides baekrokdamisoli]|uniref:Competence damage-inducible protein A n=1 Tax=Nocardioides baekrokdamisoli TaxID=1804624 RepID=A0A3G9IAR6_9ACTN|nr:nicotinamide-nucleotide amidohydrolase family protein [Nocardioides baekrokdamisoli]BBH15840.1 competence damage-inducible protein A [Nocardioides baekrokdamisoli]